MDNSSSDEQLHRLDERMPTLQIAVPAAEVLKQILEKMLENERRRVRNEFIRIGSLFLGLLLLIMAGGFWIVRDILIQVQEARVMSEHSHKALLTLLAASAGRSPAEPDEAAPDSEPAGDIQQTIAELEGKNKALAELTRTDDRQLNALALNALKTRDEELRTLRARVKVRQAAAMSALPADQDAPTLQQPVQPPGQPEPPTVKVTLPEQPLITTLIAPVADDLPLRLPIPAP